MILYPHCKINIGLYITSKRDDGYHEISSLLYPVMGLTDIIEIIESQTLEFSSSGLVIDCPIEKNLCYKAYQLLRQDFDIPPVKIHLHKHVPMGAGLGGGSSDATFVLKGLDSLFSLGLTREKLKEYSLMLGSDTPFFLYDGAMEVAGRGDILAPSPLDLSGWHITIIKPDIHISTKEAFLAIDPRPMVKELSELIALDPLLWQAGLSNDFECGIFVAHPHLAYIKQMLLDRGATYAAMSGSGSTIYALSQEALEIEKEEGIFYYSGTL